jgi:hypothetical protein
VQHESARQALKELDGKLLNTREIRIDVFREKVNVPVNSNNRVITNG